MMEIDNRRKNEIKDVMIAEFKKRYGCAPSKIVDKAVESLHSKDSKARILNLCGYILSLLKDYDDDVAFSMRIEPNKLYKMRPIDPEANVGGMVLSWINRGIVNSFEDGMKIFNGDLTILNLPGHSTK